ncbi:MAG: N-acetylmuramoyl-L-alanine amidase [Actinomycetota bacterium]
MDPTLKLYIRQGDRSGMVADVQARLRALGGDINDDPARFGAGTENAVRAFQQQRGILVDGIVGPHTWRELVEAGWRLGDRPLYLRHPPLRGDDVEALQTRLNALGFDAGRADGIFGRDTDRAVRAFQREYDVAEDGIYGPRSLRALAGLRVERAGTASTLREELRRVESAGTTGAVIVIDPGHGGSDPGEVDPRGAHEADLCWDLATRLARQLSAAGAHVRFTRSEAEAPDDSERARRANDLNADLFLSLHLNVHGRASAQGASTYYWGGSKAGELLAESVQQRLVGLGLRDCRAHPRAYPLLKETRMPAVLVEPAFITNPEDRRRLDDPVFRSALVDALAAAVRHYYEAAP